MMVNKRPKITLTISAIGISTSRRKTLRQTLNSFDPSIVYENAFIIGPKKRNIGLSKLLKKRSHFTLRDECVLNRPPGHSVIQFHLS